MQHINGKLLKIKIIAFSTCVVLLKLLITVMNFMDLKKYKNNHAKIKSLKLWCISHGNLGDIYIFNELLLSVFDVFYDVSVSQIIKAEERTGIVQPDLWCTTGYSTSFCLQ